MNRTALTCTSLICLTGAATALLLAGPLDPPAGPIAPTYKTLSEVEPRIAINATNTPGDNDTTPSLFKITQAGSYYLSGNISVGTGLNGIEIDASNVTLDLMGFRVLGLLGARNGILVNGAETNLTIRNGSVRSFSGDGLSGGSCDNVRVSDFTARNCTGQGVSMGNGCTAVNVIAESNSLDGIKSLNSATLTNCVSRDNGGNGFACDFATVVTNCTASDNTGDGFSFESGCVVDSCIAFSNGDDGFAVLNGSTFTSCQSFSNDGDGFDVAVSACVITSCIARSNDGYGIRAGADSTIAQCAASLNTLSGIFADRRCIISSCTSRSNSEDGILVVSGNTILGNTCAGNGSSGDASGIHVTGTDNRIEGNNCTFGNRGIEVDFFGNIIIGNTSAGNFVPWTIVANNYYGPMIDIASTPAPAVNGGAAAGSLATTDPHANFSY